MNTDYRSLEAYQLARALLAQVCAALTSSATESAGRLRQAAVSVPIGIVDGMAGYTEGRCSIDAAVNRAAAALDGLSQAVAECRMRGDIGGPDAELFFELAG